MWGNSTGSAGVYGVGPNDWGVYGNSTNGYALYGYSENGYGLYARTYTTTRSAGYFYNGGGSGTNRGTGVSGYTGSGSTAFTHPSGGWWNAGGEFSGPNGLIGAASESSGVGVLAINSVGGTALYASKPSSSGGGTAFQVSNSGTGAAVSVDNNAASTTDALQVFNYGTGRAGYFYNGNGSTSNGLSLYNYGTGPGSYFYNSSAYNGDAFVLSNSGNGDALNVYRYGTGRAAYFSGDVYVNGTLGKAGGGFKIDHPLDPANQYLQHSFVESPDMMNVYNGNITTDANGEATVMLPDYFEALNRDFRYQLTVIGQFAQVMVKDEIQNNRFTIKTDKPNVKVSWQVTGIRQDAWANANRLQVEETKPVKEQDTYLYPEGFGQPASEGIDYARRLDRSQPHRRACLVDADCSVPADCALSADSAVDSNRSTGADRPAFTERAVAAARLRFVGSSLEAMVIPACAGIRHLGFRRKCHWRQRLNSSFPRAGMTWRSVRQDEADHENF